MKIGFIILFLFFMGVNAYAQRSPNTPDPRSGNSQPSAADMSQNVSQINVDDLSDDQIRQYIKAAQERGITQSQVEAGLRQRGMSEMQIQKLRMRIQNLGQEKKSMYYETEKKISEERESLPAEDQLIGILENKDYQKTQEEKFRARIFGSSLFGNPSLTFEPSLNMATPSNYKIGPGDEIIIDIWGASEANFTSQVTPEGHILIRNLGPVYVNGLTVEEASKKIIGRLSSIFSGLQGANPSTHAQISLGNVRRVKVSIIGEVVQPGTYTVSSLSTVFNALHAAGGPNANGTFRDVQVIRDNKTVANIDLYQFLITGEQTTNIRLEDQDIIRVGPYLQRIQLTGEVKRKEDLYELKPDECVADLVNFAGGFTDKAFTHHIRVKRNTLKERKIVDVPNEQFKQFALVAGDEIHVEPILDRFENRVQISGAVFREGEYELSEGLTVKQLIQRAEGLRGDAFLERATIYRTKEDYSTEVVPFCVKDLMKNDATDIVLQREDLVKISSIYDLNEEYFVEIKGEVKNPGVLPYMGSMNVEDVIIMGGGLLESASNSHIEVVRRYKSEEKPANGQVAEIFTFNINRNLSLSQQDLDFSLMPFDMVFVRKSPGYQIQQTAQVAGEVVYPGFYGIQSKNERISDLIKRSGGLTDEAYLKGATLLRKTEFSNNDNVVLAQKINELKSKSNGSSPNKEIGLTESDHYRNKRLAELVAKEKEDDNKLIYENKKKTLRSLSERDSAIVDVEIDEMEAIGIRLEEILKNPGSKYDLMLQDGDILNIPKELQTVRLRGELLYPITVRYDKKFKFIDYVSRSGGFSTEAKKGKSYVVYANGSVDRTKKFLFFKNYPSVEPGAEIIVPSKPDKSGMSTQETVGIATGVATLGYLIITIVNSVGK